MSTNNDLKKSTPSRSSLQNTSSSSLKSKKSSSKLSSSSSWNKNRIYFFVPNLIGYTRVILTFLAMILMSSNYHCLATFCYGLSCFLDALDGFFARKLSQCSRFGAVLDMVTDRSTTSILLCYLCISYGDSSQPYRSLIVPLFQGLLALDLSSHYMHMVASMTAGESSHKNIPQTAHPLLRLYYQSRWILFFICAGNELFFILLYIYSYVNLDTLSFSTLIILKTLTSISFIVCTIKQVINVIQLVRASDYLVQLDWNDVKERHASSSTSSRQY